VGACLAYNGYVRSSSLCLGLVVAAIVASTATASGSARISGGTPTQRRVVRAVLVKLGSQRITGVTFKPHAHLPGITNGQEMEISGIDRAVRTYWDENLFVAAYLRESLTRRTQEPKLIVMNGDSFVPVHGPRRPGRIPPPGPRASAKVIAHYVSSLKEAAAGAKAHVVGVDVMRPGPIGVALTLRVSDPARFLKHRLSKVLAVFDNQPKGILARYLGVQGPTRTLVFEVGNLAGSIRMLIAPKLGGCGPPITTIGSPGSPPCPAK
jgi:hypothetical protein